MIENLDALIDLIEKNHNNYKIQHFNDKTNDVFISKNEIIDDIKEILLSVYPTMITLKPLSI